MLVYILLIGIESFSLSYIYCNEAPFFIHDLSGLVISEHTEVGSVIGYLNGSDPEGSPVYYGIDNTDFLSVNETTGQVTLKKPLDREVNDTLWFEAILKEDRFGSGENNVHIRSNIIVDDENDTPPKFLGTPYEIYVAEDTAINATIFNGISVEDIDLNGENLEVFCISDEKFNSCEKFRIYSLNYSPKLYEGGLILTGRLNYNEKQLYKIRLVVTDGVFNSSTAVEIRVQDIQNLPPIFQSSLTAIIDEDASIGSLVISVQAKDGDRGNPRPVAYELITNPYNYFSIDSHTGEIRTSQYLDRERLTNTNGVLLLKVRASEIVNGVPSTEENSNTTTDVSITIRDVNDESPQFNKEKYYVSIPENFPLGSPLPNLDMIVSDSDIGNNSVFSLRMEDVSGRFSIEPNSVIGSSPVTIRLANGSLDYENVNQRKFSLLVIAQESSTKSRLTSTNTVIIQVTDVNDNSPYFESSTYSSSVNESAVPGTVVDKITAMDHDSEVYGILSIVYELTGEGSERFTLDRKTGVISVAACPTPGLYPCLDYESKSSYFLTYKAADAEGSGNLASVSLKISLDDDNDNRPMFIQEIYNVSVDEGERKFEPPFFVKAEDLDKNSRIIYSIPKSSTNLFAINSETGEIVIQNKTGLWKTTSTDVISFVVNADDGVFRSSATVNVLVLDVNNNEPFFMQELFTVEIPEDTRPGEIVYSVNASDDDSGVNSEVSYQIEKGAYGNFEIDSKIGTISVHSKLDYDKRKQYNLTVLAVDKGTPTLTGSTTVLINILNSNDKDPYFVPQTQHAEVPENAKVGTVFYVMIATDPDTNDTEVLNFAISDPITAVDKNGKPVTDNALFKTFFQINKSNGALSVSSVLRRDIAASVTLTVIVVDKSAKFDQKGKGTVVISILDVNDKPPTFAPPWTVLHPYYVVSIREEMPVGTILGTFIASDPESEIHHYAIHPENDYFIVNETSGAVSVHQRIDFEEVQSINFTLKAYDIGVPQLSSDAAIIVNILNINDNSPIFEQSEYHAVVKENTAKGSPVLKVKAVDKDLDELGKVKYDFKGSYVNDFIIDEQTGEIRVANSAALDFEKIKEIILKVEASDLSPLDERKSSVVPVHINIEDVNDNEPVFTQRQYSENILETIPYSPPSPIVQLQAEDKDVKARLRYYIVNGNDDGAFNLDSTTGRLYPKRSLLGFLKKFKLTIEVTDGKFTDKAVIEINVLNVNQHKPVFKEPSSTNASVLISEDVDVGHLVTTVLAQDDDGGENGRVTYYFRVGSIDTLVTDEFGIDENSGELRTLAPLDREKNASYQVILVAKDHGSQNTYETLQFFNIVLKDVNDNKPMFSLSPDGISEFKFSINENNAPKILIGKVYADDADEGENARVYYYIIRGNEYSLFSLERRDGSVYALGALDREQSRVHEFYIKATNNANYNSAANEIIAQGDPTITKVTIVVIDENDNVPRFLKNVYYAGAETRSKNNSKVAKVEAVDPDSEKFRKFHYEIKTSILYRGNTNLSSGSLSPGPFIIDTLGGVYTRESLLLHNQDRFELHILAVEDDVLHRETEVILNVWVYEIQQLARVVVSQSHNKVQLPEIVADLTNATGFVVVIDEVTQHFDRFGQLMNNLSDLYLHLIDNNTQEIIPIEQVLRIVDAKYDELGSYYVNILPALSPFNEEPFEFALAALVALSIVLIVGCISVIILCCCFKHWVSVESLDMKCDVLIKKPIIDDLSTTENPLWIEQKLKLYEEQELTMQVFCEPEMNHLSAANTFERRESDETSVVDNTYATIQHSGRQNSASTLLTMGPGDYVTLGGSILPRDHATSQSQQAIEVALGFQGCTFQVPDGPADTTELLRVRSELHMNQNGEPELMSELI